MAQFVGFYAFLEDKDDITPDFKIYSASHEKISANFRQSMPQ
jgi:hypothetical protein